MKRVVVLLLFCAAACALGVAQNPPDERRPFVLRSVRILYFVDEGGVRVDKPSYEQFEASLRSLPLAKLRTHFSRQNIDLDTADFELARTQEKFLKNILGNYFWSSGKSPANALDLEFGFKTCVQKMDIFQGWSFSMYPSASFRMRLTAADGGNADYSSHASGEPSCDKRALEEKSYFRSDDPSEDDQMRLRVNEYYAAKIFAADFPLWLNSLPRSAP